ATGAQAGTTGATRTTTGTSGTTTTTGPAATGTTVTTGTTGSSATTGTTGTTGTASTTGTTGTNTGTTGTTGAAGTTGGAVESCANGPVTFRLTVSSSVDPTRFCLACDPWLTIQTATGTPVFTPTACPVDCTTCQQAAGCTPCTGTRYVTAPGLSYTW